MGVTPFEASLLEKIEALERRVRELESRPPQIVTAPVIMPVPPAPPICHPITLPYIVCGAGAISDNASPPTYPDFSDTPTLVHGNDWVVRS